MPASPHLPTRAQHRSTVISVCSRLIVLNPQSSPLALREGSLAMFKVTHTAHAHSKTCGRWRVPIHNEQVPQQAAHATQKSTQKHIVYIIQIFHLNHFHLILGLRAL